MISNADSTTRTFVGSQNVPIRLLSRNKLSGYQSIQSTTSQISVVLAPTARKFLSFTNYSSWISPHRNKLHTQTNLYMHIHKEIKIDARVKVILKAHFLSGMSFNLLKPFAQCSVCVCIIRSNKNRQLPESVLELDWICLTTTHNLEDISAVRHI